MDVPVRSVKLFHRDIIWISDEMCRTLHQANISGKQKKWIREWMYVEKRASGASASEALSDKDDWEEKWQRK